MKRFEDTKERLSDKILTRSNLALKTFHAEEPPSHLHKHSGVTAAYATGPSPRKKERKRKHLKAERRTNKDTVVWLKIH